MHSSPFVLYLPSFFPPEVVDQKGLGGWWLSLNDPVYFEKVLISARGFLSANKDTSKHHLSTFMCRMHNAADDIVSLMFVLIAHCEYD